MEPASTEWVIVRRGFVHMEGVREQHYCTLACAVSVLANDLVREAKK